MIDLTVFRLELESKENHENALSDVMLAEKKKSTLSPPPMYQVVLLNDDFTPMDFVVVILEKFFTMPTEKAAQVMLTIHTQGKAVCGVFTKDIAETKVQLVNKFSRENQHPLLCKTEKAT